MRFFGSLPRRRWLIGGTLTAAVIAAVAFAGLASTQTLSRHAHASGSLNFALPISYLNGPLSTQVITGDVNGDGRQDIIAISLANTVCDSNSHCTNYPNALEVLLNNGDGTFRQAPGFNFDTMSTASPKSPCCHSHAPTGLVAGDFNGDGKLDVAVLDRGYDVVYVLLGNGDGTFRAPTSATTITFPITSQNSLLPTYLAVGDFNHDGKLDLAVTMANNATPGAVYVLLGHGDGTFVQPSAAPGPGSNLFLTGGKSEPFLVAAGDFNGDGKLDLVTVNVDSFGYVCCVSPSPAGAAEPGPRSAGPSTESFSVLLGDGAGNMRLAPSAPVEESNRPVAIALGDFNGDGKLDISFDNYTGIISTTSAMDVWEGHGDGTFSLVPAPPTSFGGYQPNDIETGDFNGDGKPDLVVTTQFNHVYVLLSNGNGTFQPPVSFTASPNGRDAISAAVGDFNSDGLPDIALTAYNVPGTFSPGEIDVLLNTSTLPTKATLSASTTSAVQGDTVSFTSTVVPTTMPAGMPPGSVTFKDGSATLATVGLNGGKASYSTSGLALGIHTITAIYSGSSRFQSSTSAAVSVTIGVSGQDVAGSPAGGSPPSAPATGSTAGTGSGSAQQANVAQPNAPVASASSQQRTTAPRTVSSPLGPSLWLGLVLLVVGLGGIGRVLYRAHLSRRIAQGNRS